MRRIILAACLALLPTLALGQIISGGQKPLQFLGPVTQPANVGNGADLTEDTLATFNVAAGQLANVGDRLHIVAGGSLAASTDNKTVRLKVGNATTVGVTAAAASVAWRIEFDAIKTGSNTQSIVSWFTSSVGNNTTPFAPAGTMTDTAIIAVLVTGQNATNSVANSITCRYLTVDYTSVGP